MHVSPRLQISGDGVVEPLVGEGTLSQFSDFSSDGQGWTSRMANMQFRVELELDSPTLAGRGTTTWTVRPNVSQLDVSLWERLFPGTSRVVGYTRDSLMDRTTLSYRTKAVADLVKQQYQAVGKTPSLLAKQPTVLQLAQATSTTNSVLAGFAASVIEVAGSSAGQTGRPHRELERWIHLFDRPEDRGDLDCGQADHRGGSSR